MGQKVNPNGFRLGINKDWKSKWYSSKNDFADKLLNDIKVREYLKKKLKDGAVSNIVLERNNKERTNVKIYTARPGVIIGQGGKDIEVLRNELKKLTGEDVYVQIVEVKNPDMNAQLVADSIASQIENRASFRNAQKRAIRNTMKAGAKGIKTKVSGRLGGADTTYGKIGVKVWIYKGEILGVPTPEEEDARNERPNNRDNRRRGDRRDFKDRKDNRSHDEKGGNRDVDAKES